MSNDWGGRETAVGTGVGDWVVWAGWFGGRAEPAARVWTDVSENAVPPLGSRTQAASATDEPTNSTGRTLANAPLRRRRELLLALRG